MRLPKNKNRKVQMKILIKEYELKKRKMIKKKCMENK